MVSAAAASVHVKLLLEDGVAFELEVQAEVKSNGEGGEYTVGETCVLSHDDVVCACLVKV